MKEPGDTMFLENANLQHPRRHHEFFLRSRPYRGEPPTVAGRVLIEPGGLFLHIGVTQGLLLYPDTPAKTETTSREAFCFRPISHQDRSKGDNISQNAQQECNRSHLTSSTQTGKGSRQQEAGMDGLKDHSFHLSCPKVTEGMAEMQSQYQKDFLAPSSGCRRPTPVHPQPDNIGINPGFRMDFNTVQRQTYPRWPSMS